MSASQPAIPEDSVRFLDLLWQQGEVREVRIPKWDGYKTASGYFDAPEKLAQAASAFDGRANVYVTLNPVNPALLARAQNRIDRRAAHTTADTDIVRRRWLFLDIDSVRPSGISATRGEVEAAMELLERVTSHLSQSGWPDPLTCLSGNGAYALYRIDLPNSAESLALVQGVLTSLHHRLSTDRATIDTSVANASRILGLVGTRKLKGDATEERPHRRSELLAVPPALLVVAEEKLREISEQVSAAVSSSPPSRSRAALQGARPAPPLREILDRHGLDYREQPADATGVTWYHLRRCPFHADGRDYECGVGQKLPEGPYAGHCFHPEGQGRGWQEWKRALDLAVGRDRHDRVMVTNRNGDEDPSDPTSPSPHFPRTDAGNGELFAHLYRDRLRYDHRRDHWLVWDTHHWQEDADGEVRRLAIQAARERYRQAEAIPDLAERQQEAKFAVGSENRQRLDAMLGEARCLPPIATDGEHWDQDPWLLGVGNGVIDLRTGTLRPGRPEDNMTCFTEVPYDPEARCPRWRAFLAEIFRDDTDLIDFVWRTAGYALTGTTQEQCLFLCHGRGANGKSIFLALLRALLGRYAYNAPFSTFELRARSEVSNDVAALAGRRLVTAAETNDSTRLNEARVKALTGCDPMTARFLYGENFTFRPVAKFFLAANHLPLVADDSYGFWRRVRLLPFGREFTSDADPGLEGKLLAELPGILTWAVAGCLSWQREGLTPPEAVLRATEDYRETSDLLAEFVAEHLTVEAERSVGATEVFTRYQEWARGQALTEREMLNATAFGKKMGERFTYKKTNKGKRYLGVGFLGDPVQEVLA
ncbi:MAG: DNA primase family protein [Thermoleophilia bacterium]